MPYVVGSPIDAFCSECKKDATHRVLEVAGIQVREVRCDVCGAEGSYRTPRAKAREAIMGMAGRKKKTTTTRKPGTRRKAKTPEEIYAEHISGRDLSSAAAYSIKDDLEVGDLVDHPSFGVGVVTELTAPQKAKVVFETGERVMACNRT